MMRFIKHRTLWGMIAVFFWISYVSAENKSLDQFLKRVIKERKLSSISVGIIKERKLVFAKGYGFRDRSQRRRAGADTIYLLASCSKPVVGIATAKLQEELKSKFDLDKDVNVYLKWAKPLKHPYYPSKKITMRHLLTHTGGIKSDSDEDYDSYPKPDPNKSLDQFMQSVLKNKSFWLKKRGPGDKKYYSNLGAALAALVVEKVAQQDFKNYCNEKIFAPLGMKDTRWFYNEFSREQKKRIAKLYDEDFIAYDHYGFNDYPSGQLRSSVKDFSQLIIMMMSKGKYKGTTILEHSSMLNFEQVPMFIGKDTDLGKTVYFYNGLEYGVLTSFAYRKDGTGYVYMMNTDIIEDEDLDEFQDEMEEELFYYADKL